MRITLQDLGISQSYVFLPSDLVGRVFTHPTEKYEVTVRRASYFAEGPGRGGWVLDTDAGTFRAYAPPAP